MERIKPLTLHLISLLNTVPEFEGRVGPAISSLSDPSVRDIPVPCAWVLYVGAGNETQGNVGYADANHEFSVSVVLSYESADILLNNSYKTLDSAVAAVSGKDSLEFAQKWRFAGQQLVDISANRMTYEIRFQTVSTYC